MKKTSTLAIALASTLWIAGCGESGDGDHGHEEGTHTHADGTVHKDGDHADDINKDDGHDHGNETELPAVTIGDMKVELAQSHGAIEPGKEGHLIVKLPYNDSGATVVRAWIGTEDHTLFNRQNGEYAASKDEYDIHSIAPDPLPKNVMWWIEIEKPDGAKAVGSAKPATK